MTSAQKSEWDSGFEARRMIRGMEAKWAIMQQPDYQARQRTAQPEAA